jgi:hypothetical protein
MHRMILGAEQGMVGDLRDKDGLNNQVENLRVCDRSRNVMGAARYRLGAVQRDGSTPWQVACSDLCLWPEAES